MEGRWRKWMMIMAIHGIGIIIFTRGFLLTRTELPYYSHCSDVSQSPCFSPSVNFIDRRQQQQCWTKPAVDRLIIIVLDALRFDFVAPSSFFPEKKPWMDKLSVLQKMAFKEGSSARIFKAIADPPTTSLQRLKGLTTGGLPTFIDVGNSFGAPAIIEDNFIHQLVINGKRTLMMGDDTWVQLFPHHFNKSFPYPSFNVKDLHTVDNGCIDHLFPSISQDDWDVLIAHFLGVDHAGHIFGVDSVPMIEKLEQYNLILEKLIEELESQSGPGGLHENTLLVVMGDHGQTLNGDHGGGSAEEVETSIFAMSFKQPPFSIPSELDSSSCEQDLEAKKMCTSSIQQLDFAVTVSALLGVSFPFGSIGRVNPELYALGSGTWNLEETKIENCKSQSNLEDWVQNYVNVLCINSWQVKRYIDVYSASSMIGFSSEDLLHLSNMYNLAEENWSNMKDLLSYKNESCHSILPGLTRQIDAYFDFLSNVSELARSKWTEFNLKMMGIGLGVMLMSLLIMFLAIQPSNKPYAVFLPSPGDLKISSVFAFFIVAIRACSLFSNSFILEEGKVASFLLATTGIVKLRHSILRKKMLFEAIIFLLLVSILRLCIEVGLSKQATTSSFMSASPSWMLGIAPGHPIWMYLSEFAPLLAIILLAGLLYRTTCSSYCLGVWKYVIVGTVSSYILIAVHWGSESSIPILALLLQGVGKSYIPRLVYAIGLGQLTLVAFGSVFTEEKSLDGKWSPIMKTVAILSAWSSTIILLSGKQGSLVALASIIGVSLTAQCSSFKRICPCV
ncbi:uncharacterized protein LOC126659389 isoform X2 [Mercurialis annua]|uniref:uncharacterized protein LOC126659389 isoform X2 n=1 Tax=Mercurialis annua TaxID=3986 RepID=UPI00215E8BFC|nr:uncharacterized protein LOC126659389 isoform X2 [Mercurialis annua]